MSQATPRQQPAPDEPQPVAALLAIALPGAGHAFLGEVKRGLFIFAGVMGLFVSGLLIGGIDVVDREEDFIWFLGEALVGPVAFGVDYVHQSHLKAIDPGVLAQVRAASSVEEAKRRVRAARRAPHPGEQRRVDRVPTANGATVSVPVWSPPPVPGVTQATYSKSLGRVNELGTLFCTIAGMLNLICIIDAGYRPSRRREGVTGGVA